MSLPQITVIGNLKRIETKYMTSGKQMTKFQIECSEKNSKGEWTNLYLSGECWEKSAQFLEKFFKDGSPAIVTGKLFTNVYEKSDGTKVYENKLLFPNVGFVPKDKSDQGASENTGQNAPVVYENNQQQRQENSPLEQKLPSEDSDFIPF